jgi:hypothetical protein
MARHPIRGARSAGTEFPVVDRLPRPRGVLQAQRRRTKRLPMADTYAYEEEEERKALLKGLHGPMRTWFSGPEADW